MQDVRRHLGYWVLLAAPGSLQEVGAVSWDDVRAAIDRLPHGKTHHLGMVLSAQGWHQASNSSSMNHVLAMLKHFAVIKLHLDRVTAVKIGRGCGSIPPTLGHTTGLLMKWVGPRGAMSFIELRTEEGNSNRLSGVSLREEHTATWEELRFILWLFVEDDDLVVEQHKGSVGQPSLEDPGGRGAEGTLTGN